MTTIKLKVSACGKFAQPVNHYLKPMQRHETGLSYIDEANKQTFDESTIEYKKLCDKFNCDYPPLPLTEPCEPGSEIDGEPIYQVYSHTLGWVDISNVDDFTIREIRKAYRPIKESAVIGYEKAISYCKHMEYSKTGSQYSAFITGHNLGFSAANQQAIELLEVERDAYAKLADEENDLLLKNIANGVAIALTDILLNKINRYFKPTK